MTVTLSCNSSYKLPFSVPRTRILTLIKLISSARLLSILFNQNLKLLLSQVVTMGTVIYTDLNSPMASILIFAADEKE